MRESPDLIPKVPIRRPRLPVWMAGREAHRIVPPENDPPIKAGNLALYLSRRQAFSGKREIHLTYKEYEILRHIMDAGGDIVSREDLLARVWGYSIVSRSLDVHMHRLRRAIERSGVRIQTVRKVGFRLETGVNGKGRA